MGIIHIEDLKIDDFLATLKKINDYEVSEKIDGTINIAVGVDAQGLFVGRPSKGQKDKIYHDSWPKTHVYNSFRFAFAAFKKFETEISKILRPHEGIVEFEVLYGYMPNSIAYDNEGLVILRTIEGPRDLTDQLAKVLKGKKAKIIQEAYHYGINGRKYKRKETHDFTFWYKQIVHPPKYDASIDIKNVENVLKRKSSLGMSNWDVLKISLTKVKKDVRPKFKLEKSKIEDILRDIKVGIKSKLQDIFLYSVKSTLSPDIDFIEGVVLRDKATNELVKIVDRDVFTGINKFLWQYRELITSGVMTDKGWEKSILVRLREAIGDALGVPLMKTLRGKKMARDNPAELYTMLHQKGFKFENSQNAIDVIKKLVKQAQEELDDLNIQFKASAIKKTLFRNFKIGSRNVTIKYDEHTIRKTQDSIYDAKSALRTVINSLKTVNNSLTEYEAWIKIFQIYSLF